MAKIFLGILKLRILYFSRIADEKHLNIVIEIMTKGFIQKVVNAMKQTSDEFVRDKINTKLSPEERILATKIMEGIESLKIAYQGKPMETLLDIEFKSKLHQIQSDISKLDFQTPYHISIRNPVNISLKLLLSKVRHGKYSPSPCFTL